MDDEREPEEKPAKKRKKPVSMTQLTLKCLRGSLGDTAEVVERWNPYARVTQDLFGFVDIVSLRMPLAAIVAVQCTSSGNLSKRVDKIIGECGVEAKKWLSCGGRIEAWGWRKILSRGREVWSPRVLVARLVATDIEWREVVSELEGVPLLLRSGVD